jgi:two-component system, LytTR family, response regulator
MRMIIIEDEPLAAERLQFLLQQYDPLCSVDASLESIEESVKWFSNNKQPDIIFSDIQLSDGSAFEIFRKIKISSPVIFTTAYDKYALDAFKCLSIDYLLKPFTLEALRGAMDKLKLLQTQVLPSLINYEDIIRLLQPKTRVYKTRFTGKIGNRLFFVKTRNIALFYADNKIVYLVTTDNEKYIAEYTLEQLEELLDKNSFFRINRSMVVNICVISQVKPYDNNRLQVILKNNMNPGEAIVSRERVLDFRKWADN